MADTERFEYLRGRPTGLEQEREQDVLAADEAVAQFALLLSGEAQDLVSAFCQVLAQSAVSCLSMAVSTDLRLAWRRS